MKVGGWRGQENHGGPPLKLERKKGEERGRRGEERGKIEGGGGRRGGR